jgi:hypothetical protein
MLFSSSAQGRPVDVETHAGEDITGGFDDGGVVISAIVPVHP